MSQAEKLSIWTEVREALLLFLEEGILPWEQEIWPKILAYDEFWPVYDRLNDFEFPEIEILINIAMKEKDYELIICLYDIFISREKIRDEMLDYNIAMFLIDYNIDRAIEILNYRAEDYISRAKTNDYSTAIKMFQDVKNLMIEHHQKEFWLDYFDTIKIKYKRKIKFITLANTL